MRYLIFLSIILCVCFTNLLVSVSHDSTESQKPITKPIIDIITDKKTEQQPEENIHKNDLVRIKQSVEVYYVLTNEYEVCTELWCTYKNKLHNEANNCLVVKKEFIESTKRDQFNKIFPRYEKLNAKVKNRLMPW